MTYGFAVGKKTIHFRTYGEGLHDDGVLVRSGGIVVDHTLCLSVVAEPAAEVDLVGAVSQQLAAGRTKG